MSTCSDALVSPELSPGTARSFARPRDAVMLALRERGIRPRPLTVLTVAFDLGFSEDVAVEIAASLETSPALC